MCILHVIFPPTLCDKKFKDKVNRSSQQEWTCFLFLFVAVIFLSVLLFSSMDTFNSLSGSWVNYLTNQQKTGTDKKNFRHECLTKVQNINGSYTWLIGTTDKIYWCKLGAIPEWKVPQRQGGLALTCEGKGLLRVRSWTEVEVWRGMGARRLLMVNVRPSFRFRNLLDILFHHACEHTTSFWQSLLPCLQTQNWLDIL